MRGRLSDCRQVLARGTPRHLRGRQTCALFDRWAWKEAGVGSVGMADAFGESAAMASATPSPAPPTWGAGEGGDRRGRFSCVCPLGRGSERSRVPDPKRETRTQPQLDLDGAGDQARSRSHRTVPEDTWALALLQHTERGRCTWQWNSIRDPVKPTDRFYFGGEQKRLTGLRLRIKKPPECLHSLDRHPLIDWYCKCYLREKDVFVCLA